MSRREAIKLTQHWILRPVGAERLDHVVMKKDGTVQIVLTEKRK